MTAGMSTVGKTIAVLDALAAGETQLARIIAKAGLTRQTTHRTLRKLVDAGWVRRVGHGKYVPVERAAPAASRRPPTARELEVVADALQAWCTRQGMPAAWVNRLRLFAAARAVLEALHEAGPQPAATQTPRSDL